MPVYADPAGGVRVHADALRDWTSALLARIGTPDDIGADVAEVLVAADVRGIASHGTARLPQYVKLVEAGLVDPGARPALERDATALALFDARNGWGHHAARVAMDEAIERAARAGLAASTVRNSNHYGIAGWYAMRAAERGMIGISLTNSSPLVAPTRAREPLIGTNPIAVAAPAGRFGMLVLDMATSTVPRGRIEVAERRGEPLLPQWAIGPDGSPALTAAEALLGALHPLGGPEETGGYKGYGLALAVDLLTGVLAGARYGPNIVPLFSTSGRSDLGHFLMAIDPATVTQPAAFVQRLEHYCEQLVSAPTVPGAPGPVLIPGQPEAARAAQQARDGIVIDREHHAALASLAERLGLAPPG